MLSHDLAVLYGTPPRALMQAVKRNRDRFPDDFHFQLTKQELGNLKSQSVTSSWGGARRARPYAFTEEGVAMLSAVLRSPTAIAVSIQIMRAFVRLRQALASSAALRRKLATIERRLDDHDHRFGAVYDAIRAMMDSDDARRRKPPIGYRTKGQRA
jgi:hypothetical protein